MAKTKQASTRRRRKEVTTAVEVFGVSWSLASGASAAAVVDPVWNVRFKDTLAGPGITLSEEEVSDVSGAAQMASDLSKLPLAVPRTMVERKVAEGTPPVLCLFQA
jgi:hypothetical protein